MSSSSCSDYVYCWLPAIWWQGSIVFQNKCHVLFCLENVASVLASPELSTLPICNIQQQQKHTKNTDCSSVWIAGLYLHVQLFSYIKLTSLSDDVCKQTCTEFHINTIWILLTIKKCRWLHSSPLWKTEWKATVTFNSKTNFDIRIRLSEYVFRYQSNVHLLLLTIYKPQKILRIKEIIWLIVLQCANG